jgi:four helix bundle protein
MTARWPNDMQDRAMGSQVFRSGTSVGARYRKGRRARSRAASVIEVASPLQELDQTACRLEPMSEPGMPPAATRQGRVDATEGSTAMLAASAGTAKGPGNA